MAKKPFGFDEAHDSHGFLLWQTTTLWQRRIKKTLEHYDISHAQFVILASLLWFEIHNVLPTQILLARQTKIDKMTISKSLKKLNLAKYITREESISDTRAKVVRLTKKGKDLVSILVPLVENIDKEFFGKLNETHQKSLLKILSNLNDRNL